MRVAFSALLVGLLVGFGATAAKAQATYTLTASVDKITGTAGNDVFSGPGGGVDTLKGGSGSDAFYIDANQAGTIDGGPAVDTVYAQGTSFGNVGFANVESLVLKSEKFTATVDQLSRFRSITTESHTGLVFFKLEGAGGTLDFLSALPSTPPYYIPGYVDASHLTSGLTFTAGWGGDIVGTAYADKLMAGSGYGGRILDGGGGDDVLIGGFGDNTLKGGPGHDTLDGGGGTDRADYRDKTTAVVVTLNGLTDAVVKVGGFAEDTIRNIEGVLGGSGNDTLTGDANSNVLNGGAGNDKLVGGDGVDRLTGGLGADHLYGGSDGWGDFFIYTRLSDSTVAVSGRDIIEDFSESDGDQIDLRLVRTVSVSQSPPESRATGLPSVGRLL